MNKIQSLTVFSILLAITFWQCEATSIEYKFGSLPKDGDSAVCYDLSADGDVLELNYATGEMRTLWKIPLKENELPPDVLLCGVISPDHQSAWIGTTRYGDPAFTLYYSHAGESKLIETGFTYARGDGDFSLIPFFSDVLCINIENQQKSTCLCREKDGFKTVDVPFHTNYRSVFSRVGEDTLYIRQGYYGNGNIWKVVRKDESGHIMIDASVVAVVPKWSVDNILESGVVIFCEDYVLFGSLATDRSASYALVSLSSGETKSILNNVVFNSMPGPLVNNVFRRINNNTLARYAVEGLKSDQRKHGRGKGPAGIVDQYIFNLETGVGSGPEIIKYDPETESMFWVDGQLKSFPKKHFDYVSMADFVDGLLSTPKYRRIESWEQREALIKELVAESHKTGTAEEAAPKKTGN